MRLDLEQSDKLLHQQCQQVGIGSLTTIISIAYVYACRVYGL